VALYVYGVVGVGTPVPADDRGLGAVVGIHDDALVAVCSQVADEPLGRRRELRAHADVLGDLARQSPVVPFTFGTVLPDEQSVHEVLRGRAIHLLAELDRLADVVQMTVRLVPDEQRLLADVMASSPQLRELEAQGRSGPGPGNQAQQLRLGEAVAHHYRTWVEQLSAAALEALASHAREVRVESDASTADPVQAAFLVSRGEVSAFLQAGGEVAAGMHGRMVCRITGPLPPYSFVEPGDRATAPSGVP
jgi:hypothetical protein